MSDETLRMWMSDLSDRIEQMGKFIRLEFAEVRKSLHLPDSCPTKKIAESCRSSIEEIQKNIDRRRLRKSNQKWELFKEILKSVLTVAGSVAVSWFLFRFGLG